MSRSRARHSLHQQWLEDTAASLPQQPARPVQRPQTSDSDVGTRPSRRSTSSNGRIEASTSAPTPPPSAQAFKPEHSSHSFWNPGKPSKRSASVIPTTSMSSKLPESLQKVEKRFADITARFQSQVDLLVAYPTIHKSQYAAVTTNSRTIPARDRILHCLPPPGCPVKAKPLFLENPGLNQRTALVRVAAGGYDQIGYALKDFMTWACMHDIEDARLMPTQPDVLEAYLASLAGFFSRKLIVSRIAMLKKWHRFYDVDWIVKNEDVSLVIEGAAKLAPYPKLKRKPLLVDTLVKIYPFLDLNNSFDRAWWSATTFAHRGCLRSGEFTVSSIGAFDKNRIGPDEPLFTLTGSRGRTVGKRCSMSKSLWCDRLAELLAQAGLPPMSGHTVRIGGATQLLLDGVDPLVVKVVGRWKSDAFELYWRNITAVLARYTDKTSSASAPSVSTPGMMLEELRALAQLEAA